MADVIITTITKGILQSCKDQQGGINKLYVFPYVKYSKSQIGLDDQVLISFPDKVVYDFQAVGISFTESTSLSNGGVEWSQNVSFTIPKTNESSEIYRLMRQDYCAIYVDRNGNYRIIGLYNGAEVSINAQSGTNRNELNGYKVSLKAKEDNQAYYISESTFNSIFTVSAPAKPTIPSAPSSLVYSNFTGGATIDLSWDAATGGTGGLAGYYVYINNSYSSSTTGTSVNISGLEGSTDYSFYVRAYDNDGSYGPKSNTVNVTTLDGYSFRVESDGGIVESLECITQFT